VQEIARSCANLARLVLCFIACFILLVIAALLLAAGVRSVGDRYVDTV